MLSHLVMAFAFAADVERCSTADDVCLLQLKQAATSTTAALSYLEGDELDPSSTVIVMRYSGIHLKFGLTRNRLTRAFAQRMGNVSDDRSKQEQPIRYGCFKH